MLRRAAFTLSDCWGCFCKRALMHSESVQDWQQLKRRKKKSAAECNKQRLYLHPFLCHFLNAIRKPCECQVNVFIIKGQLWGFSLSAVVLMNESSLSSHLWPSVWWQSCACQLQWTVIVNMWKDPDSFGFSSLVTMAIIAGAESVFKANRTVWDNNLWKGCHQE